MIDYSNIPSITNHQTFFVGASANVWQTWVKPKNCNFVFITAIGGGGGGGSSSNVAGNGGGGGGGGSSSITKIIIPSVVLPDTLYVKVGVGGNGGTGGSVGGNGELSTVAIRPNISASDIIIRSGSIGSQGGSQGTSSVGGTGGGGDTVFTVASGFLSSLGIWDSIGGDSGANGGFTTNGSTKTALQNFPLCGGGGGGGKSASNFAGGSILAGGVLGRVAGGAGGGGNGNKGIISILPQNLTYSFTEFPFATTGGSGGGSNTTISGGGGNGGNGEIGSGGGGSGAIDGGTGRVGGRGGHGLVIISTF